MRANRVHAAANLLAVGLLLAGCGSSDDGLPTIPVPTAGIGTPVVYTSIPGDLGGSIALRLKFPATGRYVLGPGASEAPIVVDTPVFLTESHVFHQSLEPEQDGFIHLTFLWPGTADAATGRASIGVNDYGGIAALSAFRRVLQFATGQTQTVDGYHVYALGGPSGIVPLHTNVGIYAFSHPGIPATNVLALYGSAVPDVSYFVGRENPTQDLTTSVELGHWTPPNGPPVQNPFYAYPADYDPDDIDLSAAMPHVGWSFVDDRPFFDDGVDTYLLGTRVPRMFGLRCFSRRLTHALDDNGVFALSGWPADVATPAQVDAWWTTRQTTLKYTALGTEAPQLRVMLVFANDDHVQVAFDKPHIHQAWDGFVHAAGLPWVRLNPDLSYVEDLYGVAAPWATDHDALWEPADWTDVRPLGYMASANLAAKRVPRAAVAEMADRTQYADWSLNLAGVLP